MRKRIRTKGRAIPVISFSKTAQLQAALRSCDLRLQPEIMEQLERLRREE